MKSGGFVFATWNSAPLQFINETTSYLWTYSRIAKIEGLFHLKMFPFLICFQFSSKGQRRKIFSWQLEAQICVQSEGPPHSVASKLTSTSSLNINKLVLWFRKKLVHIPNGEHIQSFFHSEWLYLSETNALVLRREKWFHVIWPLQLLVERWEHFPLRERFAQLFCKLKKK